MCLFKRLVLGSSSVLRDFFPLRGTRDRRTVKCVIQEGSEGEDTLTAEVELLLIIQPVQEMSVFSSGDRSEGQSSRDPLPLRGPPTNCHGSAAARCTVQGMHRLRKGGKIERETKVKGGGKRHLRARALKRKKTGSRKKKNHARELGLNKEKNASIYFPLALIPFRNSTSPPSPRLPTFAAQIYVRA